MDKDFKYQLEYLLIIMGVVACVAGVVFGLFVLRKYKEHIWGYCSSRRRMEGKIIIITGGNSGIGKETAKNLVGRGATVVLACRNRTSAQETIKDIRTATADGQIFFVELNLCSLDSVKDCAEDILIKFPRIDVLINNAGVYYPPEEGLQTDDGFELHFGVNHLGHFLFTHCLLDRIKNTENSRIVIVSSLLYEQGQINFEALRGEIAIVQRGRNPLYANSKLANICHGVELAKKLEGTSVGTHVLCPGFVKTGLMRHSVGRYGFLKKLCFAPIAFLFMRSAHQGAQTTIYCAVSEELDGKHFGFYTNVKSATLHPKASDPETVSKLWDISQQMVADFL